MWKDKVRLVRDYIVKNSKIAFPVVVTAAVAVTVVVALNMKNAEARGGEESSVNETVQTEAETGTTEVAETAETVVPEVDQEISLEQNTNSEMLSLMETYYNALADGDVDTIKSIKNYVEDTEEIRIRELSNYIEKYTVDAIYTKPGPVESSYIAYAYIKVVFSGYEDLVPGLQTFYVCTDENGKLYLNEGEVEDEVLEYIKTVNLQDDVVELFNRVNVECNDVYLNNKKLFEYVEELGQQVSKATGEALAAQIAEEQAAESSEGQNSEEIVSEGEGEQSDEQAPVEDTESQSPEQVILYATTTTTVNMRISDSEQAEKVNKVPGGNQVQVLEKRANGWSKVIYEGQEGYIKSEYLQDNNTAAGTGGESIGTVTATTNVNIRDAASETANKIGVVAGGDSVELLSKDNEWCQIRYNGLIGYVKAEYVE